MSKDDEIKKLWFYIEEHQSLDMLQQMEIERLQARVEELEGALHDAFDVYTKNPNASGDDVARAMWDLLGEALQETEA